jgi:hypothetical protein
MVDSEDPKVQLGGLLDQLAKNAEDDKKIHQEGIKTDQEIIDLANATKDVLKYPTGDHVDWELSIDQAQRLVNEQSSRLRGLRSVLQSSSLNSTASGTVLSMVGFSYPLDPSMYPSPSVYADADTARKNLVNVIDRSINQEEIVTWMKVFGLDKSYPNEKTAIEHFRTAWAAYEMPLTSTSPVNTSLIPMRECIETVITQLLQRRQQQEPAKSWRDKILSLGKQAVLGGITESDVVSWANEWEKLVDALSGAKKSSYSRPEWLALLREATLFLKSFLLGLDPNKLRPQRPA